MNAGYTNLPSRMAIQASSIYSSNILKLLKLFLLTKHFQIEQKDDLDYGTIDLVTRQILVVKVSFNTS